MNNLNGNQGFIPREYLRPTPGTVPSSVPFGYYLKQRFPNLGGPINTLPYYPPLEKPLPIEEPPVTTLPIGPPEDVNAPVGWNGQNMGGFCPCSPTPFVPLLVGRNVRNYRQGGLVSRRWQERSDLINQLRAERRMYQGN